MRTKTLTILLILAASPAFAQGYLEYGSPEAAKETGRYRTENSPPSVIDYNYNGQHYNYVITGEHTKEGAVGDNRTWTSTRGKRLAGSLEKVEIVLQVKTGTGKVVTIAIDKLDQQDQEWVRSRINTLLLPHEKQKKIEEAKKVLEETK